MGEQAAGQGLAARLAASLCSGIGGHAGYAEQGNACFAYRSIRSTAATARSWRPARLPSGRLIVFHGYFDNAAEIAARLDVGSKDPAELYGLAFERWGDEAEQRIIGHYCAAIADPERASLRLVRSPIRAPPLYYFHGDELTAAASVPRSLFAAGVPKHVNEANYADMAWFYYENPEASCFRDVLRVPVGSAVELEQGKARIVKKTYDIMAVPNQDVASDAEVLETVSALLDEGVNACLTGFSRPGSTLSSGLDSPQVAVRALAALPPGQKLPTFTFHPEPGFNGSAPPFMNPDERPMVEALAALHPGLEPHFTCNEDADPLHRMNELFHLIGSVHPYVGTMYVFHGLLEEASKERCDLLLLAELGNLTFSDRGLNGFVEYLLTGQWRQLWLALTRPAIHKGGIAQRFVVRTLSAFLPNSAWSFLRPLVTGRSHLVPLMQPFSREFLDAVGTTKRMKRAGHAPSRGQPWTRRQARKRAFNNEDWLADFYQGLEQMYGVALRDPTAYRPLVEYCIGLPTRMFMRDGQIRWLARELGKGIIPEEQRLTALQGCWDADWHIRIGRRRLEYLQELSRIEQDERFAGMFDFPRLRSALEDWPEQSVADQHKALGPQAAVPTAILTARFINYVEGRNTP
ncbi:MAG TPA: asparagine synthase-related protein [Sphingomicrobium sp.]|nr:asparagine synthase-related protein [Sphingomicrobium sp.]